MTSEDFYAMLLYRDYGVGGLHGRKIAAFIASEVEKANEAKNSLPNLVESEPASQDSITDTDRLDFIESHGTVCKKWLFSIVRGHGSRLCAGERYREDVFPTAREAIDAVIAKVTGKAGDRP